ncbi:hypothetical protein HanIR_Chr13g0639411 [Helianthus annuus]|nr:hypothetical protein HanIR_Chr13g0639411 [Helianthus annuus]
MYLTRLVQNVPIRRTSPSSPSFIVLRRFTVPNHRRSHIVRYPRYPHLRITG